MFPLHRPPPRVHGQISQRILILDHYWGRQGISFTGTVTSTDRGARLHGTVSLLFVRLTAAVTPMVAVLYAAIALLVSASRTARHRPGLPPAALLAPPTLFIVVGTAVVLLAMHSVRIQQADLHAWFQRSLRHPVPGPERFIRFQAAKPTARGTFPGVFGLINALAHRGELTARQESFRQAGNAWYQANLANPSDANPTIYDLPTHPGAAAWFKSSATHLIAAADSYLASSPNTTSAALRPPYCRLGVKPLCDKNT
jgi:hypothetical protein